MKAARPFLILLTNDLIPLFHYFYSCLFFFFAAHGISNILLQNHFSDNSALFCIGLFTVLTSIYQNRFFITFEGSCLLTYFSLVIDFSCNIIFARGILELSQYRHKNEELKKTEHLFPYSSIWLGSPHVLPEGSPWPV